MLNSRNIRNRSELSIWIEWAFKADPRAWKVYRLEDSEGNEWGAIVHNTLENTAHCFDYVDGVQAYVDYFRDVQQVASEFIDGRARYYTAPYDVGATRIHRGRSVR